MCGNGNQRGWIHFGRWPLRLERKVVLVYDLHDWKRRVAPLLNYTLAFALQLRKSGWNLSQNNREDCDYSLRRLDRVFGTASTDWPAEYQSTSVTRGEFQSPLGTSVFQDAELRTSLHQLTLSRNCQCSRVVGGKRIPQILVNSPVNNLQRCVSRIAELRAQKRLQVMTGCCWSRTAWVKINQKNAMQQRGECGISLLYSRVSRLFSFWSHTNTKQPNPPVLPSVSYSRLIW
jgi:hypothetical protein